MKKFFVSLVMLLSLSAASVFAQSSLIATLSHEGEITPFYGANALKEAHEAAVHGDAITLSSGTFIATDITKAITLRGAGMQLDTVNNVLPTILSGTFNVQIADATTEKLTIEGIAHNLKIYIKGALDGARFLKSRFQYIELSEGVSLLNCSFLHCKVVESLKLTNSSNCSFIGSYIYKCYPNGAALQFVNSILHAYGNYQQHGSDYAACLSAFSSSSFYNCVLIGVKIASSVYGRPAYLDQLPSSAYAYNCIAMNIYNNADCFEVISNKTNSNSTFTEVFADFTGTYNDGVTFELTDEAKTKFLGTDGTQVGIYGGNIPFDPTTTNPYITKCNVAAKSTADGKLSVDIEVAGVE